MRRETTKVCQCGNTYLALLSSLNKKYCPSCHTYIDWYLAEGQKSPLTSHIGGLVDIPLQVPTDTPSPENTMSPTEYFIPLNGVSLDTLADFCDLFAEVNNTGPIPHEFIAAALEVAEQPNMGILVIPSEPIFAVGELRAGAHALVIPIAQATFMLMLQRFLVPNDYEPEPEEVQTTEPPVPTQNTAAQKYVKEYNEVIGLLNQATKQCGIKLPSETRVEQVKYLLTVLTEGYRKSFTTH